MQSHIYRKLPWESLRPHYISGNFWAYEYFVPHEMEQHVELKGGELVFEMGPEPNK